MASRAASQLLRRRQGGDGVGDELLDSFRRDPRKRSGFFLPALVQNGRDIVAVAHSLLDGVARRHRVAPIVEQLAHEQCVGALTPQASPLTIFGQLGPDGFEQSRVDDRRVLAGIALVAMVYVAEINSVAQHIGQWPIGESSAPIVRPEERVCFRVTIPLSRKSRCNADNEFKVEIAREDQPRRRRLFLFDDQFAVPDFGAQRDHAPDPKALSSMRRSCRGCARPWQRWPTRTPRIANAAADGDAAHNGSWPDIRADFELDDRDRGRTGPQAFSPAPGAAPRRQSRSARAGIAQPRRRLIPLRQPRCRRSVRLRGRQHRRRWLIAHRHAASRTGGRVAGAAEGLGAARTRILAGGLREMQAFVTDHACGLQTQSPVAGGASAMRTSGCQSR